MLDGLLARDAALLEWLLALPHPEALTWIFRAASRAGIGSALWLAAGAVLLVARQITWKDASRLVIAIAMVHAVVDLVMKPWFGRVRPPLAIAHLRPFAEVPETLSFPSGHAANAIAAAIVLGRVWRKGRALVWAAAAVVAVARVYLGVHYPFDAVAGCVTGALCAWAALAVPLPLRQTSSREEG
jgi:membrane-associated phospholipid phosphatase